MRRTILTGLVLCFLVLPGCLISTQEGERTHVNSPPPEEIAFHFDTGYNKLIVFARSAFLLSLAIWFLGMFRKGGGGNIVPVVLAVLALGGSGWLLVQGWSKTQNYRIEVKTDLLHMSLPGEPERKIAWDEVTGLEVEGMARDVRFGSGKGQALKWAPQWESMVVTLAGDRELEVDLRPLSVEQRGTFWRAIVSKASLEGGVGIQER